MARQQVSGIWFGLRRRRVAGRLLDGLAGAHEDECALGEGGVDEQGGAGRYPVPQPGIVTKTEY